MSLKTITKKLIPKSVLNLRHLFYAWLGAFIYRHPSDKLLVIGVTGASGKSSVVYFLRQLLENAGYKTGALSTIEFCVSGECRLNDKKMTMLGKTFIQKYLRKMAKNNCDVAIIETTSEGAIQYRHQFINYDFILLTNLYPEHIESHGGFENYKQAKLDIFEYVSKCERKIIKNKKIAKIAIVNNESEYKQEFLDFDFDKKITFGKGSKFSPANIRIGKDGLRFLLGEEEFFAPLYGEYNVSNIAGVAALARNLDIGWDEIKKAVSKLRNAPGRIEFIPEAEKLGFKVIVDYAFEPVATAELYKVVKLLEPKRIIHVFGATGGGRDKAKRAILGEFIGERADICVITDEDPYDDDPMEIIDEVAAAAAKVNKNLFKIRDRGEAIKKAIDLAEEGDLILITGKGSEQAMAVKGKLIPWDDRSVVRKALAIR